MTGRRVPLLAVPAIVVAALVSGCVGSGAPATPPVPGATDRPAPSPGSYLVPGVVEAPPIDLTASDGSAFSLDSLRGEAVLLSFGYTHCPDVCPATVGLVGEVITALAPDVKALFVTIDPARDTVSWLQEYVKYLAPGYRALTGSADQIRATASAWGVQYARVDTGDPAGYGMTHTSDVFLVDRGGLLRARFPFGTGSGAMTAIVKQVLDGPEPSGVPTPGAGSAAPATPLPTGSAPSELELGVAVVSTSVWSGGHSPLILALTGPSGRIDDANTTVSVQLETTGNAPVGPPVPGVRVQPEGASDASWVASVDIPSPGWWRFAVTATAGGETRAGSADVAVLDPGTSAALGASAPTAHTPTLADVGQQVLAISTDPAPDLRLYRTSTTDALAARQPFVLVIDSTRFRTTTACGKALVMVRYLIDRWPQVAFIHLEPFRYDVVTNAPVLEGTLMAPTLVEAAGAWGIGGSPWGATSMPWIFVVDGSGTVRAKYQGVIGSDDVDVIVSLIEQGG